MCRQRISTCRLIHPPRCVRLLCRTAWTLGVVSASVLSAFCLASSGCWRWPAWNHSWLSCWSLPIVFPTFDDYNTQDEFDKAANPCSCFQAKHPLNIFLTKHHRNNEEKLNRSRFKGFAFNVKLNICLTEVSLIHDRQIPCRMPPNIVSFQT